jgi:hypothetical protein
LSSAYDLSNFISINFINSSNLRNSLDVEGDNLVAGIKLISDISTDVDQKYLNKSNIVTTFE